MHHHRPYGLHHREGHVVARARVANAFAHGCIEDIPRWAAPIYSSRDSFENRHITNFNSWKLQQPVQLSRSVILISCHRAGSPHSSELGNQVFPESLTRLSFCDLSVSSSQVDPPADGLGAWPMFPRGSARCCLPRAHSTIHSFMPSRPASPTAVSWQSDKTWRNFLSHPLRYSRPQPFTNHHWSAETPSLLAAFSKADLTERGCTCR